MLPLTLSTGILLVNSVWDIVSALSICLYISNQHCSFIANAHLLLWIDEQPNNQAAFLMAFLLIQWALLRLHGALSGPTSVAACTDASLSYVVEGMLVLIQILLGNMHCASGWFVVIACVGCWAIVMRECPW